MQRGGESFTATHAAVQGVPLIDFSYFHKEILGKAHSAALNNYINGKHSFQITRSREKVIIPWKETLTMEVNGSDL